MHKQVSGCTVNFCSNSPVCPQTGISNWFTPPSEKLHIWDDQSLLLFIPPQTEKLQICDDQSLLQFSPPQLKNFRFEMTTVYSSLLPPPRYRVTVHLRFYCTLDNYHQWYRVTVHLRFYCTLDNYHQWYRVTVHLRFYCTLDNYHQWEWLYTWDFTAPWTIITSDTEWLYTWDFTAPWTIITSHTEYLYNWGFTLPWIVVTSATQWPYIWGPTVPWMALPVQLHVVEVMIGCNCLSTWNDSQSDFMNYKRINKSRFSSVLSFSVHTRNTVFVPAYT